MIHTSRFLLAIAFAAVIGQSGSCQQHPPAQKTAPPSKTNAAIRSLKAALAASPKDPQLREALGLAYENAGKIELAIAQYRALREAFPDDPEYVYRLGRAYLAAATSYTERLQAAAPRSVRVQQLIAEKLADYGSTQRAIDAYRKAILIDPELPELHLALGKLYREQGDAQAALGEVRKELQLVPGSAEAQAFAASLGGGKTP